MAVSVETALRESFGLDAFRPWQREAIDAVLEPGARVLVVAPTGGGKSLTYQLPGAVLPGLTLVLSPLVALMEDQVRSLTGRGVPATYIASTLDIEERNRREGAMLRGEYKLVYVAPERLGSDVFVRMLSRCDIQLVAIDEAHCIAQWGHDFRPDYLRIGALLERLQPPRVLACTATATPDVRREIRTHLGWEGPEGATCKEILRGFARPNLHLTARHVDGPKEAKAKLVKMLTEALGNPKQPIGGAIVYAATRKATEQYETVLTQAGFAASAYHAGMEGGARSRVANAFAKRKISVVVATNAFGMGIDRPDIRVVVHVQPPASIEAYYQEVGRAGRDGEQAWGLLLCSGADIGLRKRFSSMGTGDEPVDPVLSARAWELFRELLRYLDARSCRHDFVLRYFGDEAELLGGCGHCDVCEAMDDDDPRSAEEITLIVRKALSAVARAQKRAGLLAIAEMMHGVDSERGRRFGFTQLSTFGILREHDTDWLLSLLRVLLAAGYIDLTPTEHPVPYLTRSGASVMKGEVPPRVLLPVPRAAGPKGRTPKARGGSVAPVLPPELAPVFERLRAHRAQVAKERNVPAYVIAFDRTLVEMATHRPNTPAQLLAIHGMGPSRVDQYGDGFLRVLGEP